jgi:hypothetical protein
MSGLFGLFFDAGARGVFWCFRRALRMVGGKVAGRNGLARKPAGLSTLSMWAKAHVEPRSASSATMVATR